MTDTYSVAAVIPLYNGAKYIREALESVLAQTDPVDEILVVDDGSTDGGAGLAIVNEMAKRAPITILRKQNGGQSSARNMAVASARSRYIAFLDQDDLWYADHNAALKQPFKDGGLHKLGYVYSNVDRMDAQGRMIACDYLDTIGAPQPKRSLADCLGRDMFILPSASLVDREAYLRSGGLDERLAGYEDDDLFTRMFAAGYRGAYINRSLGTWRLHSESASYSKRMAVSRMIYFRKVVEAFPDEPGLDLFWVRDVICPRYFNANFGEFMLALQLRDVAVMDRAWADILEIAPHMRPRQSRKIQRLARILPLLYRHGMMSFTRKLLRRACR